MRAWVAILLIIKKKSILWTVVYLIIDNSNKIKAIILINITLSLRWFQDIMTHIYIILLHVRVLFQSQVTRVWWLFLLNIFSKRCKDSCTLYIVLHSLLHQYTTHWSWRKAICLRELLSSGRKLIIGFKCLSLLSYVTEVVNKERACWYKIMRKWMQFSCCCLNGSRKM